MITVLSISGAINQDLLKLEKEGTNAFPNMFFRKDENFLRKTLYIRDKLPPEFDQEDKVYLGRLDIFGSSSFPLGLPQVSFQPQSNEAVITSQKNSIPPSLAFSKFFTILVPMPLTDENFEILRGDAIRVNVFSSHTPIPFIINNNRLICSFLDDQENKMVEDFCFKVTTRLFDFGFVSASSESLRKVKITNFYSESVEILKITKSSGDLAIEISSRTLNPFQSISLELTLSALQKQSNHDQNWVSLETDSESPLNFSISYTVSNGELFFLPGLEIDLGDVSMDVQPSFILKVNSTFAMPIEVNEIKGEDRSWVIVHKKSDKIKRQSMTHLASVSLDLINHFGEDYFVNTGAVPTSSPTVSSAGKRVQVVNGVTLEEIDEEIRRARLFEQVPSFQTVLEIFTSLPSSHRIIIKGRISQVSILKDQKVKMPLVATGALGSQNITVVNPFSQPIWFMLFLAPSNIMEAAKLLQDPEMESTTGEINLQIQGEHLLMSTTAANTLNVMKDVLDVSAAQPPQMRIVPVKSSLLQKWAHFFVNFFSSGAIHSLKYSEKDIYYSPELIKYKSLPKIQGDTIQQKWKAISQDIYLNESYFLKKIELGPQESMTIPALNYVPWTDKKAQMKLLVKNNLTRLEFADVTADPARVRLNVKGKILQPLHETDIIFMADLSEISPFSKTLLKPLRRVVKIENSGTVRVDISYITIEHQGCNAFGVKIENCYPFSIQPGRYHELIITFMPPDLKRNFEKKLYLANANNLFLNTFYLKMSPQFTMTESLDSIVFFFLKALSLSLSFFVFFWTPHLIRSSMRRNYSKTSTLAHLSKTNKQPKEITPNFLEQYGLSSAFLGNVGRGREHEETSVEPSACFDEREAKPEEKTREPEAHKENSSHHEETKGKNDSGKQGDGAQSQKKSGSKQGTGKKGKQSKQTKEKPAQTVEKGENEKGTAKSQKEEKIVEVSFVQEKKNQKNQGRNLRIDLTKKKDTGSKETKKKEEKTPVVEAKNERKAEIEEETKESKEIKEKREIPIGFLAPRTKEEEGSSKRKEKRDLNETPSEILNEKDSEKPKNEGIPSQKTKEANPKLKEAEFNEEETKKLDEETPKSLNYPVEKPELQKVHSKQTENASKTEGNETKTEENPQITEAASSFTKENEEGENSSVLNRTSNALGQEYTETISRQSNHTSVKDIEESIDHNEEKQESKSDSLEEMDKSFNSFSSSGSEHESSSTPNKNFLHAFLPPAKTEPKPMPFGFRSFIPSKLQSPAPVRTNPAPPPKKTFKQHSSHGVMKAYLEKYRQKQTNPEEEYTKAFDHQVLFPFFNSQKGKEVSQPEQSSSSVNSQTLNSSHSGSSSPFQGPSVQFKGLGGVKESSLSSSFSDAQSHKHDGDNRFSSFAGDSRRAEPIGGGGVADLNQLNFGVAGGQGVFTFDPKTHGQEFKNQAIGQPSPATIAQAKGFNLAFSNPFSIRNFSEQSGRGDIPVPFDLLRDPVFGMREEEESSEREDDMEEEKVSKKPPGFDFQ